MMVVSPWMSGEKAKISSWISGWISSRSMSFFMFSCSGVFPSTGLSTPPSTKYFPLNASVASMVEMSRASDTMHRMVF